MEILAVSKTVSAERLRAALLAGVSVFGENRVQEAESKALAVPGAHWLMIGHLQSNKAARAVALFDGICSIDSLALAERVAHAAVALGRARYPAFLQVNVDADPAKAGFSADEVVGLAPELARLTALDIRGLMTVGRVAVSTEESRRTFGALREVGERVRAIEPAIGTGLSMGMSDDFELAVEEGSTQVRLGRVLFGARLPA